MNHAGWKSFAPARHTPDPARVRFALSGLFLLGGLTGLLGALLPIWAIHLTLETSAAGNCFLAIALGTAIAVAAQSRAGSEERGLRRRLVAGCVLASASLASVSLLYDQTWLTAPLIALGVAVGLLAMTTASALYDTLTPQRTPALLDLAGVSFGLGAGAACATAWLSIGWLSWEWLLRLAALGLLAAATVTSRGTSFAAAPAPASAAPGPKRLRPIGVLLGLGLFLQACNYGVLGGWLAFYLARRFGMTTSDSLAVLLVFWIAMTAGRVAAMRLPAMDRHLRSLFAATAFCLLGCAFLLNTTQSSGAFVGALLAGLGVGALHPLTLSAAVRDRHGLNPADLRAFFATSFLAVALAGWLIGQLSSRFGIEAVVWSALATSAAALLVLGTMIIEAKLSAGASAAG